MALRRFPPIVFLFLVLPPVMASAQAAAPANISSVMDLTSYVQRLAQPNHTLIKLASTNQTTAILVISDSSYAWQLFTHNKFRPDQRLLVILSTLYNTTVVRIANRDHPLSLNATLYYDTLSRSLLLQDTATDTYSPAWKCNSDAAGGPIRRILKNNTGNLVMLSTGGNNIAAPSSIYNSSILWQSFDYPEDVIVTGQKIRTNRTCTISSVFTHDWSSGRFTLAAKPGAAAVYATFHAQQTMVPYQLINYVSTDSSYKTLLHSASNCTELLYNDDGSGATLEQADGFMTPQCETENDNFGNHGVNFAARIMGKGFRLLSVMPNEDTMVFLLDYSPSGMREDSPLIFLKYFEAIDAGDGSKGFRLQTPLNCSVFEQHEFLHIPYADYYANKYIEPYATVGSADECAELCRRNCSCTAAFFNNQTRACQLYDQAQSNPSVTALLRVAHLPSSPKVDSGPLLSRKEIIGVSGGLFGTVVLLGLILGWIVTRQLAKRRLEYINSDTEEEAFLESLPGLPPRFTYKELQEATHNFSKRLGSGGSGAVYEGNIAFKEGMHEGMLVKVAVKELNTANTSTIAASSKRQFRAEVAALGCMNHVNLVRLRGFGAEGVRRLLIYEFMENGSLDRWIFPKNEGEYVLPWEVRYRIALDTARGLAFLHEDSREKVVHLDVKPQNILLNGVMRAKLADFGLSKLMERGQSQTITAMRGTPGYMAPEWFMDMHIITPKSDVFSYGMVLLELVAGRKNLNLAVGSEEWYLAKWAVMQAEQGTLAEVVDKRLWQSVANAAAVAQVEAEPAGMTQMKRLLNIAFWCIQEDANSRPSMTTVLLMLEEHLQVPEPPLHMAYILRRQTRPNMANASAATLSYGSAISEPLSSLQPR